MEPEVYFLRYAFPCSHVICKVRKEIEESEWEEMKNAAEKGKVMDRGYLQKVFHRAFERIDRIAAEMGMDRWDKRVIEEYFVRRHTSAVNITEHPEVFKDQCRVHIAKVLKLEGEKMEVEYEYDGKVRVRRVFRDYIPNAKVGDKVTIHYAYAVEKV